RRFHALIFLARGPELSHFCGELLMLSGDLLLRGLEILQLLLCLVELVRELKSRRTVVSRQIPSADGSSDDSDCSREYGCEHTRVHVPPFRLVLRKLLWTPGWQHNLR